MFCWNKRHDKIQVHLGWRPKKEQKMMDEKNIKYTLDNVSWSNELHVKAHVCIWGGLGAKSIKPWTQKTTIGSNVIC